MTKSQQDIVTLSVNRALWGAVFPQLRAVIATAEEGAWQVKFIVDGEISGDDWETLSEAGTYIAADMAPSDVFNDIVERLDWPARIEVMEPWFVVFMRKEYFKPHLV